MVIGMNGKISIIIPEDLKKISRRKLIIRFVMLTAVYMIEALLFVLFYEKFMSVEQSYIMLNAFGMIVLAACADNRAYNERPVMGRRDI